ncbi:MAG: hypothetical protein ACPL4K_02405, partial [Candidatus Margulisiibacteriota bacterium]
MVIFFLLLSRSFASEKFVFDPEGNLYKFWLFSTTEGNYIKVSKSLDQGLTFGPPFNLHFTSQEVKSFELNIGKNWDYFLTLKSSKETYLISTKESRKPLFLSGEAISSPSVAVDELGKVHIVYLSQEPNLKLNRLNYLLFSDFSSLESTAEAKVLFETPDEIVNPRLIFTSWGPAISWQKKYLNREEAYLAISLNQGKNFSPPYLINYYPVFFLSGKWYHLKTGRRISLEEIYFPPQASPELLEMLNKTGTLEITFISHNQYPTICRIEISNDKQFPSEKTWNFEKLTLTSTKENFTIPVELPEGNYFLRLSAYDGLTFSSYSKVTEFKIDHSPPIITLLSPTGEVAESREILIFGKINEKANLTLNGKTLTLEASNSFTANFPLQPGQNTLEFCATDEAGN